MAAVTVGGDTDDGDDVDDDTDSVEAAAVGCESSDLPSNGSHE